MEAAAVEAVPEDVISVVIHPMEAEAAGGGELVTITDELSVQHWAESPAFHPKDWEDHADQSPARYRVTLEGETGQVESFYLGTTKDSHIEYKCYGLCATWWVAPAREDGSYDSTRYRVMSDEVWHPLAREWYMSH